MANNEIGFQVDPQPQPIIQIGLDVGDIVSERKAEAWAVGTKNGVPVPVTDPTHDNNAKYYAQQAGVSAEAAGRSQEAAEAAAQTYPRISERTGNWEVYDLEDQEYVDTDIHAEGARGLKGEPGDGYIEYTLDTVTNTSGSYTHTTSIMGVNADMKAIFIEYGNKAAFKDDVTITCIENGITLSCNDVQGTSTVKVTVLYKIRPVIDDTAGVGDGNYVWSADKDATELIGVKKRIGDLENSDFFNFGYVEDGVAYFGNDDGYERRILCEITGIGGGGGGGGSATVNMSLNNNTGWMSKTFPVGAEVELSLSWSSTEDDEPTGDGVLQVYCNNILRKTATISQGNFMVNVKDYLTNGNNSIKVKVTDSYGNFRQKNFTIELMSIYITSSFDSSYIYTDAINVPYTPYGEVEKTIHFELDGVELETVTTSSSGRQLNLQLPAQTHGAHNIRMWFTCTVDEQELTSNVLYYEFISVVSGATAPVIAVEYASTTVDQYSTITPKYMVYTPNTMLSDVVVKIGNSVIAEYTGVDRTEHTFSYRMDVAETTVFTIVSGTASRTITVSVNEVDIDVEAETENLALYLSSAGRSNDEEHPDTWVYTDGSVLIGATFTDFDFTSNGWIRDDDGFTALRVNNDARLTIPYKIFENDFRGTGKTIEIEFATRDVRDYDAVLFSAFSGNRGLKITAQYAMLKSEQSEIKLQFKEEDHVRVAFVCEKRSENRLLVAYINGIPSGVIQYATDDDFSQLSPVNITVGHSDCTIDLYCIRVYDNGLARNQVLNNWIADTQDGSLLVDRYQRNNIYDAYGNIVIEKLPTNLPYMILEAPELPQYKGDKKTITGSYTNPEHPEKSFTFTGCQINVQGTSSAPYYRKNYDMQFKQGFVMSNGQTKDNYTLDDSVLPFNRFVMKADVASSEGANNVELVKLFCDINPFKTREMLENSKVRQGIYGFPIIIFWRNTDTGVTSFLGKYNFNFPKRAPAPYGYHDDMESWEFQNNTSPLMLFKSDYFDETMIADPTTGDEKEAWRYDYEARFPSDEWVDYTKLQELQSFIYSTYRAEATGNALSESVTYEGVTYTTDSADYRLAKFRNEFGKYAEVNAFIFYYIFTELFLMVDSRAKNLFIGFSGADTDTSLDLAIDRKAVAEPYDMDTALGTNNEGSLVFSYNLEDTDHLTGGANIFNGQESVLWNNIRDAFPAEIVAMYQTLRSGGILNYNTVEKRFSDHQAVWPEAVWIEDSWTKYIEPLVSPEGGKEPTAVYLPMMQGSKAEQRKWWLINRFKYMDSKWNAGDALVQVIQLRAYAKDDITVTPYADIYATVKYASRIVSARGTHGVPITLECPGDLELNDSEVYIYSAPQIADVGDLSGLKVGFADFSMATKLQSVKVGDNTTGYTNANLNNLTLGTNRLLKTVDARNCTALGTGDQKSVDLSGCTGLENAYFDNTAITSVVLPNGGVLKKLHIPGTVTNITIKNQTGITEFTCPSYANVSTLWLENVSSAVNDIDILEHMVVGGRIRMIGFNWSFLDGIEMLDWFDYMDTMRGMDQNGNNTEKPQLYGTVYVPTLTGAQVAEVRSRYSDITYTYDHISSVITFMNGSSVYSTQTVLDGGNATNPSGTPTKAQDAQYTYTFAGWTKVEGGTTVDPDALKAVTEDRTVYAVYSRNVRTYTVTFQNSNGTVLQTVNNVPYGGTATFTGTNPTHPTDPTNMSFTGFSPTGANITGNTTCVAQYQDMNSPIVKYLKRTLTAYESNTVTKIGEYAFFSMKTLQSVVCSATTIEQYAFNSCSNLETVDLTASSGVISIYSYAFVNCTKLKAIIIRSSSVAALLGTVLPSYNFTSGDGAIYVPADLVNSYKGASNWSTYAKRIYPISAYPVTDFSTIDLTWAQLKAAVDDESFFSSAYAVGDIKQFTYSDGTTSHTVYAEIRKIDSTNKFVDFVIKNFDETIKMNNSSTMVLYANSLLKARLDAIYADELPSDLKAAISPVAKKYYAYDGTTEEITASIWALNTKDAGLTGGYLKDSEGENYFSSNSDRVKYDQQTVLGARWWLGSAYSSSRFVTVGNYGSGGDNSTSNTCGVVFGFRIKKAS